MAKDPGSKLKTALKFKVGEKPRRFNDQIGGKDGVDLFQIKLKQRSSLNISLSRLKANANLVLLNRKGQKIEQSRQKGKKGESIVQFLEAGTYYIQVSSADRAKTRYRLISFINNSALELINNGLSLNRGDLATLGSDVLRAAGGQKPEQIVYTLTSLPQIGSLQLDGKSLAVGSTFTQADLDANRLSYTSFEIRAQLTNNTTNELSEGVDGKNIIWNQSNDLNQIFNSFFDRSQVTKAFFYNSSTGTTAPLQNSNTVSEIALGISGDNAVWNGIDTSDDIEVFLYNGSTGTSKQLTSNAVDDIAAGISGSNAIWNSFNQDYTVVSAFFYNGTSGQVTPLTHPGSLDGQAIAISGSNVVWSGFDGNDFEVFLYDGTTSIQLTNNDFDDFPEGISGSNVIWSSVQNSASKAFLYNGNTKQTIQLTTPGSSQEAARGISGENVVWDAQINGTSDVILYNISTGKNTRLTNNGVDDTTFGISGSNVVWGTSQGESIRLFFYDGAQDTTTPITDINTRTAFGGLSGSQVALTISDGADSEIFFYDLKNFAPTDSFNFTVTDQLSSVSGSFQLTIG